MHSCGPSDLAEIDRQLLTYRNFQETYWEDPRGFAHDCILWKPGEGPSFYQDEVLEALPALRRVSVRGPHGLGKSALGSWITLWFALTRDGLDWKEATTASAWAQLTNFFWPEVHKWAWRLNWAKIGRAEFRPGDELLTLGLNLHTGRAFAIASNEPGRMEGAHADHVLVMFDESKTIPNETFDALEGALSTGDAYAVAISTPGEPAGRFYEIQSRKPGTEDWWVRAVSKQECLDAGRMTPRWAEQRRRQWGEKSAVYLNRVEGEFATSEAEGIIPLHNVEIANARWLDWYEAGCHPGSGFVGIGVDVGLGGGGDRPVFALRYDDIITHLIEPEIHNPDEVTMEIAEQVLRLLDLHAGGRKAVAVVDVIGIGRGVVDRLRQMTRQRGESGRPCPYEVIAFNAAERTTYRDMSGEVEAANERAAMWMNLADMLSHPELFGVALPPEPNGEGLCGMPGGDMLTGDLTALHYRYAAGGKMLVESKEDIRKRIGRSTDHGDAVAMIMYQGKNTKAHARYQQGALPSSEWMQGKGVPVVTGARPLGGLGSYERGWRGRDRLDRGDNMR